MKKSNLLMEVKDASFEILYEIFFFICC
ncbi:MAG: hypothetical protein FD151_2071, partial [bacterium]